MAVGDVKYSDGSSNAFRAVKLLDGATGVTGVPTQATDGVPCYYNPSGTAGSADVGAFRASTPARESTIFVRSTAGSGVMNVTLRVWGYLKAMGAWTPVGASPAGDANKGKLNAGVAIGEVTTDSIVHSEPFLLAGHFDRLFLEVVAINGTSTAIDAWLVTPRTTLV